MNSGETPKIGEFEIHLEDESASTLVAPEPPTAPRPVLLVPRNVEAEVAAKALHDRDHAAAGAEAPATAGVWRLSGGAEVH